MSKYKRIVVALYGICLCLVLGMILYMGFDGKLEEQIGRKDSGYRQITDYTLEQFADQDSPRGIRNVYSWKLEKLEPSGECLGFYTAHHLIEVYLDEQLVYSLYPSSENLFGHTTASSFVMVPLYPQDAGKQVRVELMPIYKGTGEKEIPIYQGSEKSVYLMCLKSSLALLIISFLSIALGVVLIFLTLLNCRNQQFNKDLWLLGTFSIAAGLWKVSDTYFSPLLFHTNTLVLSYITLTMLLIMLVPFNLFIKNLFSEEKYRILYWISGAQIILAIGLVFLQFFNIRDLRATLTISHGAMIVDIACLIGVLVYEATHNTLTKQLKVTVAGVIGAALGTALDLWIYYYFGSSQWAIWGILGFGCYVCTMGVIIMREGLMVTKDALDRAEAANRTKSIFLSNMSHDIRTPMNAIIGFTNIAKKQLDNREKVEDCLNKIDSSSNHLLKLINDVLDMSRIESGKTTLKLEKHNLRELFQNINDIFAEQMEEKQIQFHMDTQEVQTWDIYCDALKVNQVVYNLLSNALKYTNPGGRVDMTVRQLTGEKPFRAYYEFRLKDNGIGMSPEFCQHAFQMFERERNYTESNIQGTGLGLAISKAIVDMAGGTIQVISELGKGTEFIIYIDFDRAEETREKESQPELLNSNYQNKRVLLVEDNELNREITMEIMKESGLQVETAEDGEKALEMVQNSSEGYYDLILMDIQMPHMDGYQATRAIRALANPVLAQIPIIAMTANAFEEDRQRAFEAGMNEHISKPIDITALSRVIAGILKE